MENTLEENVKAALQIGNELALTVGGQSQFDFAGRVSMLCQVIRAVYAELEKVRATVPKEQTI